MDNGNLRGYIFVLGRNGRSVLYLGSCFFFYLNLRRERRVWYSNFIFEFWGCVVARRMRVGKERGWRWCVCSKV